MLEIEDFTTLLADGTSQVKSVGGRRFKVIEMYKANRIFHIVHER